ncbi:hypothetical protein [Pseudonocardia alni]|uniref:hypothetical protein n=1 Tax=Pseudonocardia alni TaxID=33907 RepID=UPI000C2CDA3D|nr:hypothetical protein [Pseudonocardia alni]
MSSNTAPPRTRSSACDSDSAGTREVSSSTGRDSRQRCAACATYIGATDRPSVTAATKALSSTG